MRRPWWGPSPDPEQRALLDLVDDLAQDRIDPADRSPGALAAARAELTRAGLWTLASAESAGGGGASTTTVLLVLARLGGTWPTLAWTAAQANAAGLALSDHPFLTALHDGAPVSVRPVSADEEVHIEDGRVTARLGRVDLVDEHSPLVLLGDRAVLLRSEHLGAGAALRRTGLAGLVTVEVDVDISVPDHLPAGEGVARARTLWDLAAAAIAAGIAEAAAQAALDYCRVREQFGAPLTHLPAVRASLTHQASAARTLLRTAVTADPDDGPTAAAALAWTLDAALEVAAAALQAHGGYGYMAEYRVEGLLRDLVSLRAASGAAEAQRNAGVLLTGAPA